LFGCIQTSYLLGKFKFNIDVKAQGTKNAGASNSILLFGWGFGVFVGLVDILKAFLPMFLVSIIIPDASKFIISLAGIGAVLGHVFPFFMNFNGGKGMSCYFGILFFFDPFFGLVVSILSLLLVMITNYVAVATVIVLISVPLFSCFFCDDLSLNFILSMSFLSSFIIVLHRKNLFKIAKGTETTFWSVIKK